MDTRTPELVSGVFSCATMAALTVLLLFGNEAMRRRVRSRWVTEGVLAIGILVAYVAAEFVNSVIHDRVNFLLRGEVVLWSHTGLAALFAPLLIAVAGAAVAAALLASQWRAPIDPRNAFAVWVVERGGFWHIFAVMAALFLTAGAALLRSRKRYESVPE